MKIVSMVNMKGGVGKTTLTVNLADFLTNREGKKVLLIDVDPQFNATQCLLGGDEYIEYYKSGAHTIVDIFNDSSRVVPSLTEGLTMQEPVKLSEIKPICSNRGFDFIPGALQLFKLEMTAGSGRENRLKRYLNELADVYDYVLIDVPPTPSVWMMSSLIASDFYFIPVKPDPISMTGLDLLYGVISECTENHGLSLKCCGIVLTMVDTRSTQQISARNFLDASQRWDNLLYSKSLLQRVSVARGQLNNTFIMDIDDATLKSDFSAIVKEFLRRTKDEKNQ